MSTQPTTDCHAAFPGHVRSHSHNSCPDCGGWIDAPADPPTTTYEAIFPKARMADELAERITTMPYGATNVVHQPRTRKVIFDGPATRAYRMDIAETIGYFGSPPSGPVATLDGIPTPRSY